MQIEIRAVQLRDTEGALRCQRRAIESIAPGDYTEAILGEWKSRTPEAFERLNSKRKRFVAVAQAEIVGYVGIDLMRAEVTECFVVPPMARRGIGSRLIEKAEDCARQNGLDGVFVRAVLMATGFYARLGYRREQPVDVQLPSGAVMRCIEMRKDLNDV